MAEVRVGTILHWKRFRFDDGETKNKFLVIVGARSGRNWLAVIATSKKHRRDYAPGCNFEAGYYHIPGGKKDFFPVDTWLLLMDCKELDPSEAGKLLAAGEVTCEGELREGIVSGIRECLGKCEDVPRMYLDLL